MGSQVVRDAQLNGQIDVYWEYTGTSLVTYNKVTERLNAEDTYKKVKELDAAQGLTWLDPSSANNTYALAVRSSDDKTDGLKNLSDLAKAYRDGDDLLLAVNAEFPKRPDGLPGLEKAYDFQAGRSNLRPMDSGLTYQALNEDQVDVALVFATDGRIQAFDFRVLADDKGFFPDYALAPVVRTETIEGASRTWRRRSTPFPPSSTTPPCSGSMPRSTSTSEKSMTLPADFLKQNGLI